MSAIIARSFLHRICRVVAPLAMGSWSMMKTLGLFFAAWALASAAAAVSLTKM